MKHKIIQTLTLFTFTCLIASFVAYRAGMIGTSIQLSPNGSVINSPGIDTVKKTTIMPSSKSIRLMEDDFVSTDTLEVDSVFWDDIELMGGSKSGIIFEPPVDSTRSKPKKKKEK